MADVNLVEAYQRLLEQCRKRGELLEEPTGEERRRYPRVRVRPNRLMRPLTPWRLAIDASPTGIAFYSDEPTDAGRSVRIALGDELAVDVDVMACQEVPLERLHDPARYRVRCRFADEEQGLRMLIAIKEMEATQASAD